MFARSVLRWLQTIDLSQPYTNPRVDFASGFLIAEICAKYIPTVSMHSFSNFLSVKMRTDNWNQLMKIFISKGIPINQNLVDDVIKRKQGAAIKLVEILYTAFTKRKPCHAEIGDISKKTIEATQSVSLIKPPDLPKAEETVVPEQPPAMPKRQRFIGASATQRTGSQADLTPISFESASVVKGGPGFLQLRSNAGQAATTTVSRALDNAVDEVNKNRTPEALQELARCLEDPAQLTALMTNYPSDMILDLLKAVASYISPDNAAYVSDAVAEMFIPTADLETVSVSDLVEFIFCQPSDDPFTHHFLLQKVLEVTDANSVTSALGEFVKRETVFSRPLCQFLLAKVKEYVANDPPFVLPDVVARLLEFDRANAVQLIPLFAPTGDATRDAALANLYIHAPEEALEHIKKVLAEGDRGVAAYLLDKVLEENAVSKEEMIDLLLVLPDPGVVLKQEFVVVVKGTDVSVGPLLDKLDALEMVQEIAAKVSKTQPDAIDKEIVLMAVLMNDLKKEDAPKWLELFKALHEYLYLAFCDQNVCKEASAVCLKLFALLLNEVVPTFQNLFRALNFVFPTNCPAFCKANAIEFLTAASEISSSFSQTVLKLLMNFPPKTNADLDKLVAHLKKLRK